MITAYLLIASFALGALVGSITSGGEKLDRTQWAWLIWLCIFWPVLGYVYWQDWRKGL
jgi:hypothetical protein